MLPPWLEARRHLSENAGGEVGRFRKPGRKKRVQRLVWVRRRLWRAAFLVQ